VEAYAERPNSIATQWADLIQFNSILYSLTTTVSTFYTFNITRKRFTLTVARRLPGGPKGLQSRSPKQHNYKHGTMTNTQIKQTTSADGDKKRESEG